MSRRFFCKVSLLLLVIGAGVLFSGCAIGFRAPASDITTTSATLNGSVASDRSEQGDWFFKYGKTDAYGNQTTHRSINFTALERQPVSEPISGLEPGTSYHYVACADDQEPGVDAFCSHDQTFTTTATRDAVVVTGDAPPYLSNIDVNISSGPGGESPSGRVAADTRYGRIQASSITCLVVSGNRATFSGHLEPNSSGFSVFVSTVVDGGPAGSGLDRVAAVLAGGFQDCSSGIDTGALFNGDAIVIDAP